MSDSKDMDFEAAYLQEKTQREALEVQLEQRTKEDEAKRLVLEKMLDEKTKEVESGINMIQYQYDDILRKKKELELLLTFAKLTQKTLTFDAVIATFLNETINYVSASIGLPAISKEGGWKLVRNPKYDHPSAEELPQWEADLMGIIEECEQERTLIQKTMPLPGFDESVLVLGIPLKCEKSIKAVVLLIINNMTSLDEALVSQLKAASDQIRIVLEKQQSARRLEASFKKLNLAHHELKEAQGQLVQSEKMASLGQLSAGVAHEINNPIGFVLSNIDVIRDYANDLFQVLDKLDEVMTDESKDNLNKIKTDVDYDYIREDMEEIMKDTRSGLMRVRDIVADLKNFSRIDQEDHKSLSLADTVRASLKLVWNEVKYNCKVHEEYDDEVLIKGNSGQLSQVFVNFLVNASQAIGESGEIFLKVKLDKESNKGIFSIRDTGCGMDEETMQKMFDPFFTTKPVGVGTGLGLSVSFSIIEKHNAVLNVDSKPGKGTEFTVVFPLEFAEQKDQDEIAS